MRQMSSNRSLTVRQMLLLHCIETGGWHPFRLQLRHGSWLPLTLLPGMDGRIGGWMDGWMGGWMDGCVCGWLDESGWMNGWMDGWMEGLIRFYLIDKTDKIDKMGR